MLKRKKTFSKLNYYLPIDVIVEILKFLYEREIVFYSLVSKDWLKASKSDIIWKEACLRNWDDDKEEKESYFTHFKLLFLSKSRPCYLYDSSRSSFYVGKSPSFPINVLWEYQARRSSNIETFIAHRNQLYFIEKEKLKCINIDNGKIIWENTIPTSNYDLLNYSLMYHSLVYMSQKALICMSKKGDILWEINNLIGTPLSFVIKGKIIIVCFSDGRDCFIVQGIDILNGKSIWEMKEKGYTFITRMFTSYQKKFAFLLKGSKYEYICILEFQSFLQKPKFELIKYPNENIKIQDIIFHGTSILIHFLNIENIFLSNICKLDIIKKQYVNLPFIDRYSLEWSLNKNDNILWIIYINDGKEVEIEGLNVSSFKLLYKIDHQVLMKKNEDFKRFGKRETLSLKLFEFSNIISTNECVYTLNYKRNKFELISFICDKKEKKILPNFYTIIKENINIESFYHKPDLLIHEGNLLIFFKNQILMGKSL